MLLRLDKLAIRIHRRGRCLVGGRWRGHISSLPCLTRKSGRGCCQVWRTTSRYQMLWCERRRRRLGVASPDALHRSIPLPGPATEAPCPPVAFRGPPRRCHWRFWNKSATESAARAVGPTRRWREFRFAKPRVSWGIGRSRHRSWAPLPSTPRGAGSMSSCSL